MGKEIERCKVGKSPPLWFHSGFVGLSHAGASCILPLCFVSLHFSSLTVLASKTKYIYYLAVCCIRAPLAGFPLPGRMQEITRGERKEENKIRVSNSVCQPVGVARLMAAKVSVPLINTHLS